MKLFPLLAIALLVGASAQAASLKQIFKEIADSTDAGNGNGHHVTELDGKYNEKQEIASLSKEVNPKKNDKYACRFDIYAELKEGLAEIDNWGATRTANRLSGLAKKGLIRQIIYSQWDSATGDSEYCSKATVKVYGIDGSILVLEFDQTD